MNIKNAISDTCMFFFGLVIGMCLNFGFSVIDKDLKLYQFIVAGVIQILVNALIIQYVNDRIPNIGLFVLGLISSQSLLITKLYQK